MSTGRHLSSEELDLLELGSFPEQELAQAESHLAGCSKCAAQRSALGEDVAHFRQYLAPRGSPVGRSARSQVVGGWRWVALGVTAAAAILALVLLPPAEQEVTSDRYVAARGEPRFAVIVARGSSQAQLAEGDILQEGDRLRFQVDSTDAGYVLVLSLDGAGMWSVYAPFQGATSLPMVPGLQTLPGAVELDDTRGTERLLAAFSQRPLKAADVISGLHAQGWSGGRAPVIAGASAVQLISFEKR